MVKTVFDLTDEELEECIDGVTDLQLIRRLLKECVLIDQERFAELFANALAGFITEEEGTKEYFEAFDNNYAWGYDIINSINEMVAKNGV